MSIITWDTIEDTVIQTLSALQMGGAPLLATVKGRSAGDRKRMIADITRKRAPVAYVMMTGRSQQASDVVTVPQVTLWLATRSERSDDDARQGGVNVIGMYDLAGQVARALHELAIQDAAQLQLTDEKTIAGGEGIIIWEQQYALDTAPLPGLPTFGGTALAGAASRIHVEVGGIECAVSRFSFPGIDGVFERHLGTRGRAIIWKGQLCADDAAGLSAIESGIEAELRDGRTRTLADEWGRMFAECVMRKFESRGSRRIDPLTGRLVQNVVISFTQLHGAP